MWTVVYMAQNKEIANKLKGLLEKEGVLTKIQPVNKSNTNSDGYYELMVPESEIEEAHSIIIESGY